MNVNKQLNRRRWREVFEIKQEKMVYPDKKLQMGFADLLQILLMSRKFWINWVYTFFIEDCVEQIKN